MKKITKFICLAMLIALMTLSVYACSADGTPPDESDTVATANEEVNIEVEIVPMAQAATYEEEDAYDYLLQLLSATTAFVETSALDMRSVFTFGLDGATILTYEDLLELIEDLILLEIYQYAFPDFEEIAELFALQLIFDMSVDEDLNMSMAIALPTISGDTFNLLEVIIVDDMLYLGVASYVDFLFDFADLFIYLISVLEGDLSYFEMRIVAMIIDDILSRFDAIDYVAIDLSEFTDMSDFDLIFEESVEMQEEIMEIMVSFLETFATDTDFELFSTLDIISRDGDWIVLEIDEQQLREILYELIYGLYDYADDFAALINQINAVDMFGFGYVYTLTGADIQELLQTYDSSFFDEFSGRLTLRVNAEGDVQQSEMTLIIAPAYEDFAIRFSFASSVAARTTPITAPSSYVVTTDELFAIVDDFAAEFGIDLTEVLEYELALLF